METIVITNQKGGIGKSTTAQAIGAGYSIKGYNVLMIDLDPQCNLTLATKARLNNNTSYDLLLSRCPAEQAIERIDSRLSIIQGSNKLSIISSELKQPGKEYRLKEAIEPIKGNYDYIIIDTPPALGDLTINALTAGDIVVIPAQADYFSLEAIKDLSGTLNVIKKYTNTDLWIAGILLTRYQPRSILTRDITRLIENTARLIGTKVFKARIREAVAVKEAQALKNDIFTYAPKSKVTGDYRSFLQELTETVERGKA